MTVSPGLCWEGNGFVSWFHCINALYYGASHCPIHCTQILHVTDFYIISCFIMNVSLIHFLLSLSSWKVVSFPVYWHTMCMYMYACIHMYNCNYL